MALLRTVENLPKSPLVFVFSAATGLLFALGVHIYATYSKNRAVPGFPIAALDEKGLTAQESWRNCSSETIAKGLRTCDGPFQILTYTGPKIVFPNQYGEELKSHPDLNMELSIAVDLFATYPGFEGFNLNIRHPHLLIDLVRGKLNQALGVAQEHLVDETTVALHEIFGDNTEWRSGTVKDMCAKVVCRLSSRVFLGKPLCRDRRWLEIAQGYAMQVFRAARALRPVSPFWRPIRHWFMESCIELRRQLRDAQNLIAPEVERRKLRAEKALAAGEKPAKAEDLIGWMTEMATVPLPMEDYVATQLALTVGAIHTASEAITIALFDICNHSEVVEPLREEVARVISENGWSKTALSKLKLMDSFLKESQRHNPPNIGAMNRLALKDISLSDGTVIPKGRRIFVPSAMHAAKEFVEPEKFDAARFLKLREGGSNNAWQYVTVSSENLGFGYGEHACPGRFFASTELKILLSHLLLKYDFKLAEGQPLACYECDGANLADPTATFLFRKRDPEINLDLK